MNQYEGFCLIKKFSHIDDLVIVNTCCVTREAELKSLKKYKQAIKQNPTSKVIVTGCDCRFHPAKFSNAYQVIDIAQRNSLIENVLPEPSKSRYFLKIEDGCSEPCTFCIVSKIRTEIKSKSLADIKKEIDWAIRLGYKEIVLVGANIGFYGIDFGLELTDLVMALRKIPDLPRIRLSSIEPRFVTQRLVDCLKDLPFCRQFHVPIQSADDKVLMRMGRTYDAAHLERTIDLICNSFASVAIGADIIVGFPNEGEEEFSNTFQFIKANPINHLHIFPFSPRPLTKASEFGDPVSHKTKKERLWRLKNLATEKNYLFRKSLLNQFFEVVIEKNTGGISTGLTDNYIRVSIMGTHKLHELIKIKITEVSQDLTYGSACDE